MRSHGRWRSGCLRRFRHHTWPEALREHCSLAPRREDQARMRSAESHDYLADLPDVVLLSYTAPNLLRGAATDVSHRRTCPGIGEKVLEQSQGRCVPGGAQLRLEIPFSRTRKRPP